MTFWVTIRSSHSVTAAASRLTGFGARWASLATSVDGRFRTFLEVRPRDLKSVRVSRSLGVRNSRSLLFGYSFCLQQSDSRLSRCCKLAASMGVVSRSVCHLAGFEVCERAEWIRQALHSFPSQRLLKHNCV